MTDDIIDRLLTFEGSDALGNGDFSVCVEGAAEIERLTKQLDYLAGTVEVQAAELAERKGTND